MQQFSLQENQALPLSLASLAGTETFAIIVSSTEESSSALNIEFSTDALAVSDSKSLSLTKKEDEEDEKERPQPYPSQPRADWHHRLREAEQMLQDLRPYDPELTSGQNSRRLEPPHFNCPKDSTPFKVLNSFFEHQSYHFICTREFYRTEQVTYYADIQTSELTQIEALPAIFEDFDQKLSHARRLLGSESDVDRNGRFAVVFTPGVNQMKNPDGSMTTGYFFGGDLYPENFQPNSNQQEVIFINVPDPHGSWGRAFTQEFWLSNLLGSVLPHEFQHMVSFNQHLILRSGETEAPWVNEGLSHLLEDLQPDGSFNGIGAENPARIALFLHAPEQVSLTQDISLSQRGATYLLFRYLYEQAEAGNYPSTANGTALLQKLLQSGEIGIVNLEGATGQSFDTLTSDFFIALQLNSWGLTSEARYTFTDLCLTCSYNDHRGTKLDGVTPQTLSSFPTSAESKTPGAIFFVVEAKTLLAYAQRLTVKVTSGGRAQLTLIRIR